MAAHELMSLKNAAEGLELHVKRNDVVIPEEGDINYAGEDSLQLPVTCILVEKSSLHKGFLAFAGNAVD